MKPNTTPASWPPPRKEIDMTATTYPSSAVPSVRATATRRAVKAEWTKLRTLPSTWRTVAMTVVAAIGFSAVATAVQASSWATMSAQQRQAFDPTSTSLTGLWVAVVILGALGVRSVAAEYTTGMIRATFTAMPARRLVLAAKAATAAAFVFPLALVCDVVSFELGQRILAGKHVQVALSHPGTLQALIFGAVAASLVTIVGSGSPASSATPPGRSPLWRCSSSEEPSSASWSRPVCASTYPASPSRPP
jgi:ABC-2 type transport system permease protein